MHTPLGGKTLLYITGLDCKSTSEFGIENISIQNQ